MPVRTIDGMNAVVHKQTCSICGAQVEVIALIIQEPLYTKTEPVKLCRECFAIGVDVMMAVIHNEINLRGAIKHAKESK